MRSFIRKRRTNFLSIIIDGLLLSNYIRKKHLIVYLLEYLNDYGAREFWHTSVRTIKATGLQSILHPRKTLLSRIDKRGAGNLLPDHPLVVAEDFEVLKKTMPQFSYRPKISFILPVYNTRSVLLAAAIESVKNQLYENWELCIVDDHSSNINVHKILNSYSNHDRIRISYLTQNAGISEASNAAINLSTGTYIALIDHDDEITPDALYWIVKALNDHGDADIFYSDECKADEKGHISSYFFKPDWSPELLFNMMYTGHLAVYKKDFLLSKVGLFRKAYDYSQDYDLMLRAAEKTTSIRHIQKVLYHWRITPGSASQGDKPYARTTNLAAVEDAMKRRKIPAHVTALPLANRVKLKIDQPPGVSIIIPTDSFRNLKESLENIYRHTAYPDYEIVVVTNTALIEEIKPNFNTSTVVFVAYDKPYNFSDKCNRGAGGARHEILIFFNDDVRALQPDWIENTIEYLFIPGTGGVSPKLIYEDGSLQYAGMATGVRNFVGTTFHHYHKDSTAYHNYPQLVRNVSVLSGACLAMRKSIFNEIGGFDSVNTPSAHSDMDISFKIMEKGLRNVYTPYAVLQHTGHLSLKEHEAKHHHQKDKADIFVLKRWMKYLSEDCYFTDSMKNLLYHDSPQPFKLYGHYAEKDRTYTGDILIITHDLSYSGAPLNLYDLCKILQANGYFVAVCSPVEGPLRELYSRAGIPVIVDALLLSQDETVWKFARNFDFIICNTIVSWPLVKQMQHTVPTLWWLQEAASINASVQNNDCLKTLREARTVIGLSNYALSFIRNYNSRAIKIYNTCFDIYKPGTLKKPLGDRKMIISLVGSIEKRKGQDTLMEALDMLENDLLERMEIRFIGRYQDSHFSKKVKRMAAKKAFIRFYGEVSRTECHQLIRETDLLLNTSRDEAFSVALVEGFCLATPCMVSSQTGIAELINNGTNGFIYRHQDPADLAKNICNALENSDKLAQIGLEARKTYEKFLSIPAFEKSFIQLLNNKTICLEPAACVV